jgi:signal transduction histidine kinase
MAKRMSELAPNIKQKILAEIMSRSWSFVLPQLPLVMLFFLFSPWLFADNTFFQLGISSICLATVIYSLPLFFDQTDIVRRNQELLLVTGTALIGIGWGTTLAACYFAEGMLSKTTLLAIIMTCIMHAGTFVLLHIHPRLLYYYIVPAAFIPMIGSLFIMSSLEEYSLFLMVIIYNVFIIFTAPIVRKRYIESLQNETQLIDERDKVSGLMNAFPGIVTLIDNNLTYRMMNTFGHRLFKNINIIDRPVGFMNTENDFGRIVKEFHLSDKMSQSLEIELTTPHGKNWSLINLTRLTQPQGWMVIATIFIDDLVKARRDLAIERSKADATARLASLGQMAQGVAHEINNPLSVVMFSAEELNQRAKNGDIDPELFENFTGKIVKMSHRMAKIIKGLRYFSRDAEKDPIKPTSLEQIIEQAVDLQRELIKNNGIDLEVNLPDEDLMIECREVQIIQVIMNLLNNAHDATLATSERWIRMHASADETSVILKMENSGSPIPDELKEKIFEPFFSTKEVNKGTGLGLSISIGLMQQNGGDLKLTSLSPATFELRFKRAL